MDRDVVTPRIHSYGRQLVTNRNGEYYIGQVYSKVLEDRVITILDGNKSKIKEAITLEASSNDGNIHVLPLPQPDIVEIRSLNTCNSQDTHAANYTQNGDRKAFTALNVELAYDNAVTSHVNTLVTLRIYGHKKSLFGWNIYNTLLAYDPVSYEVRDHENNTHTVSLTDHSNNSNAKNLYARNRYGVVVLPSTNPPNPYFEWLEGRGITSGVGDNYWAVICCNLSYCPSQYGADPF